MRCAAKTTRHRYGGTALSRWQSPRWTAETSQHTNCQTAPRLVSSTTSFPWPQIRRYDPFLVAESPLDGCEDPAALANAAAAGGVSPASAGVRAFRELAGYLFGGNREGRKMRMTTPVLSSTGGTMAFVIGPGDARVSALARAAPAAPAVWRRRRVVGWRARFGRGWGKRGGVEEGSCALACRNVPASQTPAPHPPPFYPCANAPQDISDAPAPADGSPVSLRLDPGGDFAAATFAGVATGTGCAAAEAALRAALLRDGLRPGGGYRLARYNDPSVPPALRRNEVLIALEPGSFDLWA